MNTFNRTLRHIFSIDGEYDEVRATLREEYGALDPEPLDEGRSSLERLTHNPGGPAIAGPACSEAAEVATAELVS